MRGIKETGTRQRSFCLWSAVVILVCFLCVPVQYAQNIGGSTNSIAVNPDRVNLLLETCAALEKSLNYLDNFYKDTFYQDIHTLHNFYNALQKDIDMSKTRGSSMISLRSHTLEQMGNFGLDKLPTFVSFLKKTNRLPASFKLPVATFGTEDFVKGIARHIGSGRADVDTITCYLDGLNKASWATVGYLVGGAKGAEFFQSVAGTSAKLLREATLPLFQKGVLAWRNQGNKLVQDWLTLQERRIHDGLAIQPITEVYSEKLLRQNGIGTGQINQLDTFCHRQNQLQINMKRDINVSKVRMFSQQGKADVGGVEINPVLTKVGKLGEEQKKDVLDSRPANDSLTWTIKKKKKKDE